MNAAQFHGNIGDQRVWKDINFAGCLTAFKPSLPDSVISTCTVMLPAQDNKILAKDTGVSNSPWCGITMPAKMIFVMEVVDFSLY